MASPKHVVVDIEGNGPLVGIHSMISIGAVILDNKLDKTFYVEMAPLTDKYVPEALAVSGFTFEQTKTFMPAEEAFKLFGEWISKHFGDKRPIIWADNPSYDVAWINWYFNYFQDSSPFGWSGRRIGDFICGLQLDPRYQWKHLRGHFKHTHNALDDAKGNAHALNQAQEIYKVKL